MKSQWLRMPFWFTGEWQVIEERLDKILYNPGRPMLFGPMNYLAPHEVKVVICGQDPYPDPEFASGIAFSVEQSRKALPASLINLFKEYVVDLGYPFPLTSDLRSWVTRGVFLWNVIPSCDPWKSMSHDWPEWEPLNKDIINLITKATEPLGGVVWVFLGSVARRYVGYTESVALGQPILEYSHPSPRGAYSGKSPFMGSRMFSTINAKLSELGRPIIDWRLPSELPDLRGDPNVSGSELLSSCNRS